MTTNRPLFSGNISGDDCSMRGDDQQQSGMFSYVSLEERIPRDHPLRPIRQAVDEIFRAMNQEFDWLCCKRGWADLVGCIDGSKKAGIVPRPALRRRDHPALRSLVLALFADVVWSK